MFFSLWILVAGLAGLGQWPNYWERRVRDGNGHFPRNYGRLGRLLAFRELEYFSSLCVFASVLDLGSGSIPRYCEAWNQAPQAAESSIATPKKLAQAG
jgi:hypothetical protein